MTDEQKEKLRATYAQRKQRAQEAQEERQHTIEILRALRDNETARPGDRLKAIALLNEIQSKY
ncbi:MAG: hypothetical protein IKD93_01910 [Firmicutes bacterium]|nr:hypothetical protein [Bacillota bacterium]